MDLTREEVGSLVAFSLFLIFWSYFLIPQFQGWVELIPDPDPVLFYPLFTVVYMLLFAFLTYTLLRVLGRRREFAELATSAFRYGFAGFILLWLIPDLIAPPYLITTQGELLKTHPLWPAVSDSFFYSLLQPYVPPQFMYATVYCLVPILMFLVVLLLVSPNRLKRLVREL